MKTALFLFVAALVLVSTPIARAAYPERPVRLVVPVAPGGGNDIVARYLAHKLTARLGQQVVVDNRPGAATAIGADIVAKAAPDGYTIMLASASFAINAALKPKLPFDTLRDFAPITLAARVPQVIVVNPSVPARTLSEFVALAKSKPGRMAYASAGTGSSTHLAMEIFEEIAGISLNHVPYKGTAPGLIDVMSGQVDVTFDAIPPVLPHVKSGKVRALAVVNPRRVASLPNVPTFAESGYGQYTFASWFGIYAPARTPQEIVARLNGELVSIIHEPDTSERFIALGVEPLGTPPAELREHLRSEIEQARAIVKRRNIKVE